MFVIWQDDNFDNATQTYCRSVQQRFGLTMPVVVYANDRAAAAVGLDQRHVDLVSGVGARIAFRSQFNDTNFIPEIEALLR